MSNVVHRKPRNSKQYTIKQFMTTESLASISFSHDEESIIYGSDKSGIFNAHEIKIDGSNSKPLTASTTKRIFPVSYFPEDKRFLFQSDKGGNEIIHIYLQDENGQIKDLTPSENEKVAFLGWSMDKKSFFYESNKRDERFMDLYEMDIETFSSNLLFENKDGYHIAAVSPDKQFIALHKPITANNSDMYLFSPETGIEHLSAHEGDVQFNPVTFNKDSSYLYYLTDEDNEFLHLKRMHVSTKETETIAVENWDILTAKFSPNYNYLLYLVNNNGKYGIKLIDIATGDYLEIPDFPEGDISGVKFSPSEGKIAFLLNSSNSPSNLYVYHFEEKKLVKLTDTLNPEINQEDLVEAKVVHYPSFDGLSIPAIYYEPHLAEGEKAPALVYVHGGPGGQSMVNYDPVFQYLANHGYAIIAVNNRGSSGYGKTFFKAADLKHGEVDLADCVEAKKFLINTGNIDENKIGIIGGSYGGYMVLAALAFQPDAFKVGVDIFGVSNWERTLKSIPAWWEAVRDVLYKKMGDPYTNTEYIRSISPLFHADKIKKPLLVLQGANDPRVLQEESDEIVEAVKKNNVPVEYIVFPDEGHGFSKRENRIKGYRAIKEFLDMHLE